MAEEAPGAAIGRTVRQLRERGMWTRGEVAERSGLNEQTIAHIELGISRRPRRGTLEKIARVLGVPVETLLGQETTPGPKVEAPLPRSREEHPLTIVGRFAVDENGNQQYRTVVLWNVPEEEREYHRATLRLHGVTDYIEEELTPQAVLTAAGV